MSPATPLATDAGHATHEAQELLQASLSSGRMPLPKRVKAEVKCPKCRSPRIRFSSSFTALDGLLGIIGLRALRCHSCYNKFHKLLA